MKSHAPPHEAETDSRPPLGGRGLKFGRYEDQPIKVIVALPSEGVD